MDAAITATDTGIGDSLLTPNGYIKFTNGLIIQWGVYDTYIPKDSEVTITYNIAFTSAAYIVMSELVGRKPKSGNEQVSEPPLLSVRSVNRSSFIMVNDHYSDSNTTAYWLAIGV